MLKLEASGDTHLKITSLRLKNGDKAHQYDAPGLAATHGASETWHRFSDFDKCVQHQMCTRTVNLCWDFMA